MRLLRDDEGDPMRRRVGGFPARSSPAPRARPVNENALYSPVIVEPRSEREAASTSSRSPAMRANVGVCTLRIGPFTFVSFVNLRVTHANTNSNRNACGAGERVCR